MRPVLGILALLALAGLCRPAAADDWYGGNRDYPQALIARPMTLPRLMFQPSFGLALTNTDVVNDGSTDGSSQGEAIEFALDVGLTRRLQAGLWFAFPVNPGANFGDFMADLQVNLIPRALNLRLDIGAERVSASVPDNLVIQGTQVSQDSFVLGLGLPLLVGLSRHVAIISGNTSARGFGTPVLQTGNLGNLATGTSNLAGVYGGAAFQSNDIFALQVASNNTALAGTFYPGGALGGSLFLPIGLLIQPHPVLALGVSTGYRLTFTVLNGSDGSSNTTVVTQSVPLRLELVVSPVRFLDLGFTAAILGPIATSSGGTTTTASAADWAQIQRYDFWVALRF